MTAALESINTAFGRARVHYRALISNTLYHYSGNVIGAACYFVANHWLVTARTDSRLDPIKDDGLFIK